MTIGAMLMLMSLQAQIVETENSRWLQRHPASPERDAHLLEAERQQILESGTYNVAPYLEPRLDQIAPTLRHLQSFYAGQRELTAYIHDPEHRKSDLKSLRTSYEQLYLADDPEYKAEAEYYLGYIDYLEGNYDSALDHFSHLPYASEYQSTVPFYQMQISFLKGNFAEALKACRKMEEQHYLYSLAQSVEITRVEAECLLEQGKRDEALDHFRQYLDACKEPLPTSAYNAAVLEYEAGQYARAAQLAGMAIPTEKHLLRQYAYMLIGQSRLALAQKHEAVLAFEQAAAMVADRSMSEAAAYNVCAINHSAGLSVWGDEVHRLEEFLNTYPQSAYADRVSAFLSEAYTTTKNYEGALSSINKIRQPNQQLLQAKQRLLHQLGIQHYVNGEYAEADRLFSECILMGSLNPVPRAASYFWRGESRYHQGDYSGAIADYKSFLSLRHTSGLQSGLVAAAYYNEGYAFLKQQNYGDAIDALNQYIDMPDDKGTATYYDGMVRLADCYYYTRQYAPAEGHYHTVASQQGSQSDYACYQEALMMGLQKKYDRKQEVLDLLIATYPTSEFVDDAWLDKGRTSLLTNDNQQAVKAFQQVIDNYPDSPIASQAAVQLAMTYNNMGKTADAQRIYQLVAERYPDTDAAAIAAEDLKTLDIQQRIASLPLLYGEGRYQELLNTYQELLNQNVDFRDRQKMQLLAGKSHLQLGNLSDATSFLTEASRDMRTASGTEAKFLLAQMAFDQRDLSQANAVVAELLQSGTPHQYWLARGIILMSDMYAQQEEIFTATEYLKSLKQNYTITTDDIHTLVDDRLKSLEQTESNETAN